MGVNKVMLVGRVGKNPEVKIIGENIKLATFPMVTTETFITNDNRKIKNTEWHNIIVWRGLAGVVEQYVKKGAQLYIEGKIKTETWDGKDGQKKYKSTIVANDMQMLGTKHEAEQASNITTGVENAYNTPPKEEDLPF